MFTALLKQHPASPRARHGAAQALDVLAEKKRSNTLLQEAIDAYENIIALGNVVPDKLFLRTADRCINRLRFKGKRTNQNNTRNRKRKSKIFQKYEEISGQKAYSNTRKLN